ncbi:MAG: hypothetical protein IPP07_16910 [Holophagales bacterium]|nr:hypothetical protein [Holophagales bacterium]MBK9966474.1 hypothetical protein [Holophagales bacterium]
MTPPVFDVPLLPKTARRGDAQSHLEFRSLGGLRGEAPDDRSTRVALVGGVRSLHVLFEVFSDPPLRVLARHPQDRVFDDECVELYWAEAAEPSRYLEVVVNPEGTRYSARVANPHASRETWHLLRGVPVPGMKVRVEGDPADAHPTEWERWRCWISIPWLALSPPLSRPHPGDERRGNLTRIARGRTVRYESLVATGRDQPPDFHVPSAFATFRFVEIL